MHVCKAGEKTICIKHVNAEKYTFEKGFIKCLKTNTVGKIIKTIMYCCIGVDKYFLVQYVEHLNGVLNLIEIFVYFMYSCTLAIR